MTALPTVELDPPTISMTFGVNDSPLAGRDGTHVSCEFFLYCCPQLQHISLVAPFDTSYVFVSNYERK